MLGLYLRGWVLSMRMIIIISMMSLLTSCAYIQKKLGFNKSDCNGGTAFQEGAKHAGNWRPSTPVKSAANCGQMELYTPRDYMRDYKSGYKARMVEQCSPERIADLGRFAAERMDLSDQDLEIYRLCDQAGVRFKQIQTKYKRSFGQTYCSDQKTINSAKFASSRLLNKDLSFLSNCHESQKDELTRIYNRTYRNGVRQACHASNISNKAINDVRFGISLKTGLQTLNLCPRKDRAKKKKTYENEFRFTLGKIERLALLDRLDYAQKKMILEESKIRYNSGGHKLYTLCEITKKNVRGVLMPEGLTDLDYTGGFEVSFFKTPDFNKIASSKTLASYENKLIKRVTIPATTYTLKQAGVLVVQIPAPSGADVCKLFPR
jgi:hypothetical protein